MKKVFLYARKSSEGEDKQMLSIPSQVKELEEVAKRKELKIVGTFEESKSAKAPGRLQFAKMMELLNKGEAEGILCWKLDRLARNPVDGGAIIWATKQLGIEIFTSSQTYSQGSDNTLLMYVEFGMAQKFIDDLGKNAKRGMKTKAEDGWYPAHAPIGYRNTPNRKKGFKIIEKDETYPIVQQCFREIINGKQAIDVWKTAAKDWKLTGKTGNPISRSSFYHVITNPFYMGDYEWPRNSGKWFKGKHEAMITSEEFQIVQKMLGKHGKPIARKHTFDLTGLFRCNTCGSAMTATQKVKYYPKTGRTVAYTYYHCTRKNKKIECDEPPMTEEDVHEQIFRLLMQIRPPQEFVDWAKRWIRVLHQQEIIGQEEILSSRQRELETTEKKLNRLLDLRLTDAIDESTYNSKKHELESSLHQLKKSVEESTDGMASWRLKVEKSIDVAYGSYLKFKTGGREERHRVLLDIGSNLQFGDKKIRIQLYDQYQIFAEQEKWPEKFNNWIEPQKYTDLFAQFPDLRPPIPAMLPR